MKFCCVLKMDAVSLKCALLFHCMCNCVWNINCCRSKSAWQEQKLHKTPKKLPLCGWMSRSMTWDKCCCRSTSDLSFLWKCLSVVLDDKETCLFGETVQFNRNHGSVATCCLLQWILKCELQRHHCCRCTHLPTHSCGDRHEILSSDCSAHIA